MQYTVFSSVLFKKIIHIIIQNTIMKIALIGDSVLDNFYWLEDKKNDVTNQLKTLYSKERNDVSIHNYAVDESTTDNVLKSISPLPQYVNARYTTFDGHNPYPCNKYGKVHPLKLLKELKPEYTVLSVGGNDGRIHLSKLLIGSDSLLEAIYEDKVPEKLERLVQRIVERTEKITRDLPDFETSVQKNTTETKLVLIFVYKPHETIFKEFRKNVGWGLQFLPIEHFINLAERLDTVYGELREVYKRIAMKYNIPLIDLSLTFDPRNRKHYGSTAIEPSNESGEVIAKLIKHVIDNHDFSGNSVCYFSPNCSNTVLEKSFL